MENKAIKPDYYTNGTVDVIDFCIQLNIPFAEGNVIKYVVRHKKKNGYEDLRKAAEYIDRIARSCYGKSIFENR